MNRTEFIEKHQYLRIQKKFSNSTNKFLKQAFNCNDNETILCAVWISFLKRKGFLLTDKKIYWNIPAAITNPEHTETFFKKSGFQQREGEEHTELSSTTQNNKSVLELKVSDRIITFNIRKRLTNKNEIILKKIFTDFFSSLLFPKDEFCIEDIRFWKKVLLLKDRIWHLKKNAADFLFNKNKKNENTVAQENETKSNDLKKNSTHCSIIILRNITDFLIDVFFIVPIVLLLISDNSLNQIHNFPKKTVVACAYVLYVVFKTLISDLYKQPQKLLAFFLSLLLALTPLISKYSFILFLVFYILLFICQQLSYGYEKTTAFTKLILVFNSAFLLYLFIQYKISPEIFEELISKFKTTTIIKWF